MRITVTRDEYDSILFAIGQIESEIEGASDLSYIQSATKAQGDLYQLVTKYKLAIHNAREYQAARSVVVSDVRNRNLSPRYINQLTRKLLHRLREKN